MSHMNSEGIRRSTRHSSEATLTDINLEPINPNNDTISIQSADVPTTTDNASILSQMSDADLSYHPCSSHSADPPEESFDTHLPPNPITLSNDPTIVQLKQTLIAFNHRINGIETSNDSRFAEIERQIELSRMETQQQIQLSQASITALFTQGLETLSIQVTGQTKKHPVPSTVPPPTPPLSRPSDPPMTTPVPVHTTTQVRQSNAYNLPNLASKPKSPDPPETLVSHRPTPATRPSNHYTTPLRTNTPLPPTPPLNPAPLHHITAPPTLPPTQTIIVQPAPRDPRPLKIPNYTAKIGYSQFRTMSLLHISASSDYSSMVVIDSVTHKPILNANMTTKQSRALYLATVNALGSHASDIVSRTLTNTPDGVKLWNSLDSHFLRIHTSHVLKMNSDENMIT